MKTVTLSILYISGTKRLICKRILNILGRGPARKGTGDGSQGTGDGSLSLALIGRRQAGVLGRRFLGGISWTASWGSISWAAFPGRRLRGVVSGRHFLGGVWAQEFELH